MTKLSEYIKVMFTKDIKEKVDYAASKNRGVIIDGMFYPEQFAYPNFFEVVEYIVDKDVFYIIKKPYRLDTYHILKKHTILYNSIKFELDDKLFEWEGL